MSSRGTLAQQMSAVVMPEETIVWTGRAPAALRLRPIDAILIPFSLMWGGFALFWESSVINDGAPLFFRLWGIPFVVIGVYLVLGRFLVDAYLRGQTRYAITDRAVYIARFGAFSSVRRFAGSALDFVTYGPQKDGATIRFAPPPSLSDRNPALWSDARLDALEGLSDAPHVRELIANAGRASASLANS